MYTQSDYRSTKSNSCYSRATKKPLIEYATEADAGRAAQHMLKKFSKSFVPYRCKKCRFWHLSPLSRWTPSEKCPVCISGDGIPKDSYRSESQAETRANIIYNERGISLKVTIVIMAMGGT